MKYVYFNDTATTEIYTLSLHDALPISAGDRPGRPGLPGPQPRPRHRPADAQAAGAGAGGALRRRSRPDGRRSEEHTSELQSRQYLVCRLLLEKKHLLIPSSLHPTISYL